MENILNKTNNEVKEKNILMKEILIVNGIKCYENNNVIYLNLEDVSWGLGFTKAEIKNEKEYTSIRWETVNRYLKEIGFDKKLAKEDYIPENVFFRLAMKAKNKTAIEFQAKVADEILPSIRKHGAYITPDKIQEILLNPDTIIQLAQNLKEEQIARQKAEAELFYKNSLIEGFTDNISLTDKRRRITQIIRHKTMNPAIIGKRWNLLYKEFEMKYHMNLDARMTSEKYAGLKLKNKVDLIERGLNMTSELYEVACKLFESDYNALLEEWNIAIIKENKDV